MDILLTGYTHTPPFLAQQALLVEALLKVLLLYFVHNPFPTQHDIFTSDSLLNIFLHL